MIRKLIAGEKLTYYAGLVVGRDRIDGCYDVSDGTSVKKETVQALTRAGILKRVNVKSSTGYGYQSREAEYVLDEQYVKDFNKYMKPRK